MSEQQPSQSILITGCSSGIGLDAAKQLHHLGFQVFAGVRDQTSESQLQALGITPVHLDLTQPDSIAQALQQVLQQTGGHLDALFNNGAYGQPGAVEDLTTDVLRQQFETNVFGWHELTRQVIPIMRAQGHGRIVQNSSVLGLVCMPYRGAYNASKYAIEALTDTLRLELKDTNIKICLIEPGPILSQFRATALAKFKQHIDIEQSAHQAAYQRQLDRLGSDIGNQFTLPPSAVTKKLLRALTEKRPKARYYVTFPTYLFAFLKRILSTRMLDKLLIKG